jgi:hypothetical protein
MIIVYAYARIATKTTRASTKKEYRFIARDVKIVAVGIAHCTERAHVAHCTVRITVNVARSC